MFARVQLVGLPALLRVLVWVVAKGCWKERLLAKLEYAPVL
jgi:hypothetical protein